MMDEDCPRSKLCSVHIRGVWYSLSEALDSCNRGSVLLGSSGTIETTEANALCLEDLPTAVCYSHVVG